MLDKTKMYSGFSTPRKPGTQPSVNLRKVRILFEDDISYYVESQTENDNAGHGIRRSVKKHCYELVEYKLRLKRGLCEHDVKTVDAMLQALLLLQSISAHAGNILYKIRDLLHCDY